MGSAGGQLDEYLVINELQRLHEAFNGHLFQVFIKKSWAQLATFYLG
jgi:hypothetical protein